MVNPRKSQLERVKSLISIFQKPAHTKHNFNRKLIKHTFITLSSELQYRLKVMMDGLSLNCYVLGTKLNLVNQRKILNMWSHPLKIQHHAL